MPDNGDLLLAPGGFPLGLIPSPADERDYRYSDYGPVFTELPEEYAVPGIAGVDDQGSVGACVACSLGQIKDWQEQQELKSPIRVSRQFIYSCRKPWENQTPGLGPRATLKRLQEWGACLEEVWPGLVEYGQETWPADRETLIAAAKPRIIETYVRIESAFIQNLKSAIYTLGPALYCIAVHDNFRPDSQGCIPLPEGALRGYHGMFVLGWKPGYWLVQNSWGRDWGLEGRCFIPWEFPALEIWAITDAKTLFGTWKKLLVIQDHDQAYLDGKAIPWDRPARLIEDRFMVPARHYSESFGDLVISFGRYEEPPFVGKMWALFGRKVEEDNGG